MDLIIPHVNNRVFIIIVIIINVAIFATPTFNIAPLQA